MTSGDKPDELLRAWRCGNRAAGERLFQLLQGELSFIASRLLRREHEPISILTGDLVNEGLLRLLQTEHLDVVDNAHLLALASRAMRHALLDHARNRNRDKRRGIRVTLNEDHHDGAPEHEDVILIDRALSRLREIDARRAAVVEMRYFGGMTVEEIALVEGIAPATVKRIWNAAQLWLRRACDDAS